MTQSDKQTYFGFVTVVQIENVGFCGGLLILNSVARPLEFHCTLPVKPTKAQSILYGSTLKPHLCGEVIAKALVEKSKTKPHVLVTDCPDTASIKDSSAQKNVPTVLFLGDSHEIHDEIEVDWNPFKLVTQTILLPESQRGSWEDTKSQLEPFCQRNQLVEPFGRIRQAVAEAHQQAARRAA